MFNTLRQFFRLTSSKGVPPQPYRTFYYWLKGHTGGEIRAREIDDAVDAILYRLAEAGRLPYGAELTLIVLDMGNASVREAIVSTPTFKIERVNRHG